MSLVQQFMIRPKLKSQVFTATAGQTIFTLTTIDIPNSDSERCILLIQGKVQPSSAYTVDSTTQITLSEGVEDGDHVEVRVPSY